MSDLDFTLRADPAALPELMDQPCTYEEFRACVRDIGAVNRWTFAYRPTLDFLAKATRGIAPGQPLRILDVGSGGGDTLRKIALWAARRRIPVHLLGIDLNPRATRAAQEFTGSAPRFAAVEFRTANVLSDPAAQNSDLILSALVTHHMRDAEIIAFLRWMERTARRGWFINDLLRSARAYRFFQLFSRIMRWHPFVQHDGPVSIRRGFRTEDWHRLLTAADIPLEAVRITQPIPGRLCLTRLR
jgi:SAM-dependent methyltransferase